MVGTGGVYHPDFLGSMVSNNEYYHHNCHILFTAFKVNRKIKVWKISGCKTNSHEESAIAPFDSIIILNPYFVYKADVYNMWNS